MKTNSDKIGIILNPYLVSKVLRVVQQAEFGVDGAAARHDAGDAVGSEWNVAQQHAGVDGPVVNALRLCRVGCVSQM